MFATAQAGFGAPEFRCRIAENEGTRNMSLRGFLKELHHRNVFKVAVASRLKADVCDRLQRVDLPP